MKKFVLLCAVMALCLTAIVPVSADPGSFVVSPSQRQAPEFVEATPEVECDNASLTITAYGDRNDLPENLRKQIEAAYTAIAGAKNLGDLNGDLAALAAKLGLKLEDLSVSELFDIGCSDCDDHDSHGYFDITIASDFLKNFVCLLHYTNGEWKIVDGATVSEDGKQLSFREKDFSPFAIVVGDVAPAVEEPGTNGALVVFWIIGGVGVVALVAGGAVALSITKKKKI